MLLLMYYVVLSKNGSAYQMSNGAEILRESPQKFLLGRLINTNKNSRCAVKKKNVNHSSTAQDLCICF